MIVYNQLESNDTLLPISDFNYIYDLAKCSKCQMFTVLKSTNKMYGASNDCCCIHEIDIPFIVNSDITFRIDMIDKDMILNYTRFFIPKLYNWVILPDYYWDMYKAGDIISEYRSDIDQYLLIDKSTKQPIDQIQMFKVRLCNDFNRITFDNQLNGFLVRLQTLSNPTTFENIHLDHTIRKIFDGKVAMGRSLCRMKNDMVDVAFYMYKSLFSLGKSDLLDLDIRFDIYDTNLFMATFKPKKKKNPLTFNTYGVSFYERIHCMYINLV